MHCLDNGTLGLEREDGCLYAIGLEVNYVKITNGIGSNTLHILPIYKIEAQEKLSSLISK